MKEKNVDNIKVKKNRPTGFKVCLSLMIAIVVVIIGSSASILVFTKAVNSMDEVKANSVLTDVMLMIMPESISSPDGQYTFFVEKNEEYDKDVDTAADVISFYYLDDNGEKIYLDDGIYIDNNGNEMVVSAGFMVETGTELQNTVKNIKSATALLGLAFVGLAVWMSYYIWLDHEEKKQAQNG